MQDAFLHLWERWEKVWALADPEGYLYRTAMNLFRKRWRRASVALRRRVRLLPPDDEIALIETRLAVLRAMAALSPRQRAAIVLTDLLGYGSEEAGPMLGIAPATVRMHAWRARGPVVDHRARRGGLRPRRGWRFRLGSPRPGPGPGHRRLHRSSVGQLREHRGRADPRRELDSPVVRPRGSHV